MSTLIEKVHYLELAAMTPEDVCRRSGCRYEEAKKCYTLPVWGQDYQIYPHEQRLQCLGNDPLRHEYFPLFIVHYLLTALDKPLGHEWISEKDIPGGEGFFRGPHLIPTQEVAQVYETETPGFITRCRQLQGTPLDLADTAFSFTITPRIPVAVLCWQGDEDFLPESKLLYDRTIGDHLALDIIFALATAVCSWLSEEGAEG